MRKPQQMNLQNKGFYSIDYDMTMACNNRCPYCYILDKLDNRLMFNEDVYEQVIKSVNEFTGNLKVSLLGGDPLLIPEKVKEFTERVKYPVTIYTNLSYPERFIDIVKDINAKFIVSWHDSSKHHWVKHNILLLRDKIEPLLIISKDNIDLMYEHSLWLIENNVNYKIQFVHGDNGIEADMRNPKIKEMYRNNVINQFDTIDDKVYTPQESIDEDLINIAMNRKVICELSVVRIKYDGRITALCNNPVDLGHIKDGLSFKKTSCSGYGCVCDTFNWKVLL